jgi:hypothetical protein
MENLTNLLGALVLYVGMICLIAWPTMWMWNLTMPKMFGLTEILWIDALRLLLLIRLLLPGSTNAGAKDAK